MPKIPAKYRPESLLVIPDNREGLPYTQSELAPARLADPQALDFGDYTFAGGMDTTRAERKTLADLLQSITRERKRFLKEIRGLLGFPHRCLIVEATWQQIYAGEWRNKVSPAAVAGTLIKFHVMGLPVILAGDRKAAARFCFKFLHMAATESYRNSRELLANIEEETATA